MTAGASGAVVIGYGSELRGDDGIGPRVAEAVGARGWPGVRALALHQLTPELAEVLAGARVAVFVDARAGGGDGAIEVCRVGPAGAGCAMTHAGSPGVL